MHENFKDQSDMEITSFGAKHSEILNVREGVNDRHVSRFTVVSSRLGKK